MSKNVQLASVTVGAPAGPDEDVVRLPPRSKGFEHGGGFLANFMASSMTSWTATVNDSGMDKYVRWDRISKGLHTKEVHKVVRIVGNKAKIREEIRQYLIQFGGIVFESYDRDTVLIKNAKEDLVDLMAYINTSERNLVFNLLGDPALVTMIDDHLTANYPSTGAVTYTAYLNQQKDITVNVGYLLPEPKTMPRQCFYPNMKTPLAEYYKGFMESPENVLVLIGPPGTGKSTWLRGLILSGNHTSMLCYDHEAIQSSALIRSFYGDDDYKLLAMEDVDQYLGHRRDDNKLMPNFLNATEGILLRNDKKIVFSTNLPTIDKIDEALTREGRCYDVVRFDLLTHQQARDVQDEMGLPRSDLSAHKEWPLSKILNPTDPNRQSAHRQPKAVGY